MKNVAEINFFPFCCFFNFFSIWLTRNTTSFCWAEFPQRKSKAGSLIVHRFWQKICWVILLFPFGSLKKSFDKGTGSRQKNSWLAGKIFWESVIGCVSVSAPVCRGMQYIELFLRGVYLISDTSCVGGTLPLSTERLDGVHQVMFVQQSEESSRASITIILLLSINCWTEHP